MVFLDVGMVSFGWVRVRTISVECLVNVVEIPRASCPHALIKAAQPAYSINPTMGSWVNEQ